jgi:hypothetical protein
VGEKERRMIFMANAKKCDRCGAYYTLDDRKFKINERTPAYMEIYTKHGMIVVSAIDLCEQCMKDLWHWLCNEQETECEEDE